MTVKTTAVSVGTTATRLDQADDTGDRQPGESIAVYNDSSTVFYVGGADVTATGATKGVPVAANSWGPGLDLMTGDLVYGITASGTASAIVLETGL